jgi:Fibronectin type III domain
VFQEKIRMSKRKARQQKMAAAAVINARRKRKVVALVALVLCLSLAGGILARWRAARLRAALTPALTPSTAPGSPSKEYIYAGGRLIATEEPTQGISPAPTALVATASSTTQVNISWTAPTGAVDHYQVERSQNGSSFTVLSGNPTATSFTDSTASASTAYLYRVRAVDAANNLSAPSAVDLATTIIFTDDPLVASTSTVVGTTIMARHLVELRQAVNAVRALAGLSAAIWTYPDPVSVPEAQRRPIYGDDVRDLRTNLDQALSTLGIPVTTYTNPDLGQG